MLSIAIKSMPENAMHNSAGWSMKSIFRTGVMHVGVTVNAPYGFEFRDGQYLIAGECMCRPDDLRLKDIGIELLKDVNDTYMPPSFVLSVVALNLVTSELVVLSGLGCRRPLYYRIEQGLIAVSSHVRHIAKIFGSLALNERVLAELIVYRNITPPATIFANIHEMVGGQRIRLKVTQYPEFSTSTWSLAKKPSTQSHQDADIRCHDLIKSSIADGILGFDNPATLFSGGLDSTLVAAINRSVRPEAPLFSSSFSFADPEELETNYAVTAAHTLGLPLHIHKGTAEQYLRAMVLSILNAEEPLHHLQSVMLQQVFNDPRVSQHGVLLSGEAADSLFGNSTAQQYQKRRVVLEILGSPAISSTAQIVLRTLGKVDRRFNYYAQNFSKNHDADNHVLWTQAKYSSTNIAQEIFGYSTDRFLENKRLLLETYCDSDFLDKVNILALRSQAFKTMTIWSKLAEGAGIAVHYPFTDNELMSYVRSLSWQEKCAEPKALIRQMLRREGLPESIVARPKLGFGVATKYWALPNTLFQPIVDMADGYFGKKLLMRLQLEDQNSAMALWSALNLYLIKCLFIDECDPGALADEIVDRYRTANSIS